MTPTPNLQAAAMRAAAVAECTAGLKEANGYKMPQMAMGYSACRAAILALPLEATPAELLAEAVKLPEIAALIETSSVIRHRRENGSSGSINSAIAVDNLIAALKALETP